ncbi:unnamed protein product [Ixodes hexagonus]
MCTNRVLVRAATESPLTQSERAALRDVITERLNQEGPADKDRTEWKNFWNARVCAARKHDGLLALEEARTGGGRNPVCPLSDVEARILSIVGTDSSRGCGGLRPRQAIPPSSERSPPLPVELIMEQQDDSLMASREEPAEPGSQAGPSPDGPTDAGSPPAASCSE